MENDICNFQVIQNPSRKYANTVNLVFFRAVPLTKNFQKYVDGLSNWRRYMKKYYPDSQLQIFVDKHVLKDEKVKSILDDMDARVILFECPEYFIKDQFHIGLFGTMIRYYPMFDVNTHALKVAHIQELEPDEEFLPRFEYLNKLGTMNHGASLIYTSRKIYAQNFISNKYKFDGIYYPWIIAGRLSAYEKIPFKIFTDYLDDIKQGKKFYNIYEAWESHKKPEHGKYSFGVDEIFLNDPYLGYLINNDHTIGILVEYNVSFPVTHHLEYEVRNHPNSSLFLGHILGKKGSVKELMKDFETLFEKQSSSERATECAKRFYDILEKYPRWLGKYESDVILKFFKGYLSRNCLILIKNNKVIGIKDL